MEACNIKYVYLELILAKDTKCDVIAGLFKGLVEKDGDKLVLLHGLNKGQTNIVSLSFFNIMTIEEMEDEDYKNFAYLTAEKVDQETAIQLLEGYYENMIAGGYGLANDAEIIDIDKYENVPAEYLEGKEIKTEVSTGTGPGTGVTKPAGVGQFAAATNRYNQSSSTYTKAAVIKKDPEPTIFGRTDNKKPNKSSLEIMEEKLNQIMDGTYTAALPEIMDEDGEDAPDKSFDDEGQGHMYGGWAGGCY